jgi:hypothetical protein
MRFWKTLGGDRYQASRQADLTIEMAPVAAALWRYEPTIPVAMPVQLGARSDCSTGFDVSLLKALKRYAASKQ